MRMTMIGALALAAGGLAQAQPAGRPALVFPLACRIGESCEVQHYVDRDPGPGVQDYRCRRRTYQAHSGVDIRLLDMAAQRRGVDVLAAAAGRVARLRDGVADISIRAPGAPSVKGAECGNGVVVDHGAGWETQYCHLARGSVRVKVGDAVQVGTPLARVGVSGDTEFPHLHLTVRHNGKVVDPFAPAAEGGCNPQTPLWTAAASQQMRYKAGVVLNAGFAGAAVTMGQVEEAQTPRFGSTSPYIVAYGRAIELEKGDEVEMALTGPGGAMLAQSRLPPLDHDKAQHLAYVGKKRPAGGWPPGAYVAAYRVLRGGKAVLERRFDTRL